MTDRPDTTGAGEGLSWLCNARCDGNKSHEEPHYIVTPTDAVEMYEPAAIPASEGEGVRLLRRLLDAVDAQMRPAEMSTGWSSSPLAEARDDAHRFLFDLEPTP